jgi:hypothetical protein
MKELVQDIFDIGGVAQILLVAYDGGVIIHESSQAIPEDRRNVDWASLANAVKGVKEADLIYETGRLYLRSTDAGILVVMMDATAPSAMVRLSCDLIIPALKETLPPKGLRRFFKHLK